MSLLSRSHFATPKTLSVTKIAFAVVGAGLLLYGARRQTGFLPKLASSAGIALLTRCLGATSLAGAPAILLGLLGRTKSLGSPEPISH